MSGLSDLCDFPVDQWVAIATAVRDSVSTPAAATDLPPSLTPGHAAAGTSPELPA